MKTTSKRLLCWLLVAVMMLGMFPSAFAAELDAGGSGPPEVQVSTTPQEDAAPDQESQATPSEEPAEQPSQSPDMTPGTQEPEASPAPSGEPVVLPTEEPVKPSQEPAVEPSQDVESTPAPDGEAPAAPSGEPEASPAPSEEPEDTLAPAPTEEPEEQPQEDGPIYLTQEEAEHLPIATLSARNWTAGQPVYTWIGDPYTSITGHTYAMKEFYFMRYYADGSKEIKRSVQTDVYVDMKYYIGTGNEAYLAYCIESGVSFSGGDYVPGEAATSNYMRLLPSTARDGIMFAMMYGFNPADQNNMPSAAEVGCAFNLNDFAFATQVIIWEYQSGIRTSHNQIQSITWDTGGPYTVIPANNYVQWIEGHPAKNCYNWILNKIGQHEVVPSFSDRFRPNAPTHTMTYNAATGKYSVTLTDDNNILADLTITDGSNDLKVQHAAGSNQYTFTCSAPITSPVTISTQKVLPINTKPSLIWSNGSGQTLATGADDPVKFYFKLKTATPESGIGLNKYDPDNGYKPLQGAVYELLEFSAAAGDYVSTGNTKTTDSTGYVGWNGLIPTADNMGRFRVVERSAPPGYVVDSHFQFNVNIGTGYWKYGSDFFWTSSDPSVHPVYAEKFDVDGDGDIDKDDIPTKVETTSSGGYYYAFRAFNAPKRSDITVYKQDDATGEYLAGAVYELYELDAIADKYISTGITATTDTDGKATFTNLQYTTNNLGYFEVREVSAPKGYHLDKNFYARINVNSGDWRYVSTYTWLSGNAQDNPKTSVDINGTDRLVVEATVSPGGGKSFSLGYHAFNRIQHGSISIHKSDGGNRDLSGVQLQLLDATGAPVAFARQSDGSYAAQVIVGERWQNASASSQSTTTLTTDSKGQVEIVNLPFGQYTLMETKTQAGYMLLPAPITITVDSESTLTYDLINHRIPELPRTGGSGMVLTTLGVAMAGALVTVISLRKKGVRNHENQK